MISRRLLWLVIVSLLLLPFTPPLAPGGVAADDTPAIEETIAATPDAAGDETPTPPADATAPATPAPESPTPAPTATEPAPDASPTGELPATPEPTAEPSVAPAGEPEASATAPATPTPLPAACTLSPAAAQVGRTLRVTCSGFEPGETVNLHWDRTSARTIRASFVADGDGAGGAAFRVPEAAAGLHPVIANGLVSARKVIRTFTVVPSLSVNPRSGVVGASVRATLYGFGASEPVTLRWRHTPTRSEIVATATTTSAGTAVVWFTVPRTTGGDHAVAGAGAGGAAAERLFTVVPDLRLSPSVGRIGSSVTAKVYGFAPGERIQLRFFITESSPKVVASGVVASSTGAASATFAVPQAPEGAHRVVASGSASTTATRQYTIDEPGERWVEVNLSTQYMTVWEGNQVVNGTYVSTGKPGFETPTGTYRVLVKYVSQTMAGTIGGETYYVPDVPWVMYFTNYGHAIHGAYWHNSFGTTRSHGCINLPTYNTPGWSYDFARWLFYWLPYGARVVIHY